MKDTKIRWAGSTWNPMTGCSRITEGCDHCYAEVIAEKFRGTSFPNGFEPTFKPNKLNDPRKRTEPERWFVNSMSDLHHETFTDDQLDEVYDVMLATPRHDYLVLTKRPQRMAAYFLGRQSPGYLKRRELAFVPEHIWLGATIELDKYSFRANHLRRIPAAIRFLSCEPLLGPLPSLDLTGLHWVIAGGESGNGTRDFRVMDYDWARDLRDRCVAEGVAFYFKQSSGTRTEMGIELDGERIEEYPLPHPGDPVRKTPVAIGVYG
jgi:protein gp37